MLLRRSGTYALLGRDEATLSRLSGFSWLAGREVETALVGLSGLGEYDLPGSAA